ncbi:hypothetical protein SeLEV6574_g00020 [Synchytrium endobioticum]|uniref:sn-1-specific diacylglycerol lipase n=1 Tax=Synchytrium endobioticum TaxID=286115 RepID=A0A507DKX3_9FUNG|nr:hypothetical protein SeLEV6574_g00020 [Synchytrium endobioticum]
MELDSPSLAGQGMVEASPVTVPAHNQPLHDVAVQSETGEAVSMVVTGLSTILSIAGTATTAGFEIAKWSTRFGLTASRTVIKGIGEATGLSPVTDVVAMSLDMAEWLAIAGISTSQTITAASFKAACDSLSTVDTLFGSGETGKAVAEFARLVRHETQGLSIYDILQALTCWVSLQYLTRWRWEMTAIKGCKELMSSTTLDGVQEVQLPVGDDAPSPVAPSDTMNASTSPTTPTNNDDVNIVASAGDVTYGATGSSEDAGTEPSSDFLIPTESNSFNLRLMLNDLKRAARYSTGTYGTTIVSLFVNGMLPVPTVPWQQWLFSNENTLESIHTNHETLAGLVDVPIDSIIQSSYANSTVGEANTAQYHPTFYIIVDHPHKQVVLALRGTLSIHDLMVDLTCEYETVTLPSGWEAKAHGGMLRAAQALTQPGTRVLESIKKALVELPGYGLMIAGHSLGASLGALLTMLWGNPATGTLNGSFGLPVGRVIQCFAFACPQVVDKDTSKLLQSLVISTAIEDDFIPRLSLGSVRDLRNVVVWMRDNDDLTKGVRTRAVASMSSSTPLWDLPEAQVDVALAHGIQTICFQNEKLYPAGRVIWIVKKKVYEVMDLEEVFGCLVFSSTMASKHMPHIYHTAVNGL